jgi:trimethylamine---corrinoid protein Co-methyltransferase
MSIGSPKISLLNEEQIAEVHRNSLKILSETGIKVHSERALKLFAKAGGKSFKDNIVFIPEELVEWAVKEAPNGIKIYNRKGEDAFKLGKGSDITRYGVGVTNLFYHQPDDDKIVDFTRKHTGLATMLGSALSSYDIISTPGVPKDISADKADRYCALDMTAHTILPLVILVPSKNDYIKVIKLLEHLHGDISSKPFIVPYFDPITPLVLDDDTVEKLWHSIERGMPVIYSNYGMYGATTPMPAAGTLALLNAELLAGIVLCQLMKQNTPVIAGSLPNSFNLKNMSTVYTEQSFMLNLCCAEMMSHYGIPHFGSSGCNIGWDADLPAVSNLWMNHLLGSIGKVGFAPFVGGNFDSLVFSPRLVVYSHEIISKAREFAKGFSLDKDSFQLDEIQTQGPGANFLTSEATLKESFKETQKESLFPSYTLHQWQDAGKPNAANLLKQYTCDLIAGLKPPDDKDYLIEKGEKWIAEN